MQVGNKINKNARKLSLKANMQIFDRMLWKKLPDIIQSGFFMLMI
jgi:hypothetical protein